MFQFSGFAPYRVLCLQHSGLPHSDICGSNRMCQSPQLFAAYHVLHRLWEPRHPPYALILLIVPIIKLIMTVLFVSIPKNRNTFYFLNVFLSQYVNERLFLSESWRISESNRWPPACKAGALASWANPPIWIQNLEFRMWIVNPNFQNFLYN